MKYLRSLPLKNIQIDDSFWNRYTQLVPDAALPYQWEILNDRSPDAPASHCLQNFRVAAGEVDAPRQGTVFLDTDAYKWLEAVAYSLSTRPDPALEKNADDVIEMIGRAQCEDGYLNTYYSVLHPDGRWGNLTEGHELYCAGHLAEAAVAYYQATGKRQLLDISCRFMDLIDSVFGPGDGQIHGYPGHPEIELALVRLYDVTGRQEYLELCKYFVETRGGQPNYFLSEIARPEYVFLFDEFKNYDPAYSQSHLPVRQQDTAEGHAVRAVYLYCAMVDLAYHYNDAALLERCKILWDNMTQKRMYITGGIGSSGFLERFTTDFDLPNDSNYSETCASVGLALFGLRMAQITQDARYIDTVERALYNTVRSGIAMSGDRYFYVNPLEVWPACCMEHTFRAHVKPVRQKWFDVACCPTNIARTFASLGQYMYATDGDSLYVNLFVQNKVNLELGGKTVAAQMNTEYPKTGHIQLQLTADGASFPLFLRVPAFAQQARIRVNGEEIACVPDKGYVKIERVWQNDTVEMQFDVQPRLVYANPLVRNNVGKVAILRGPEVYCLEEVDNGADLAALYLDEGAPLREEWDADLLGGTMVVRCEGTRLVPTDDTASFCDEKCYTKEKATLTAIPYGSWSNRAPGEMIVWVHACV